MKEFWDQRYSDEEFAYGIEPNSFLAENYQRLPKGKVLCLAEGEGRNGAFLASKGYQITAVDQSEVGVAKAQRLCQHLSTQMSTVAADLNEYDMGENKWDGIVAISAIVPPAIREKMHKAAVKALKPGGVLILEAYTLRHTQLPGIGGPPAEQKQMFMSLEQLKQEFAGLQILHGLETEREMSEGRYHQGLSGVVQVIAQKPQ